MDAIHKLEQLQPLLALCASNWKANHVLGNALLSASNTNNEDDSDDNCSPPTKPTTKSSPRKNRKEKKKKKQKQVHEMVKNGDGGESDACSRAPGESSY